MTVKEFLTLPDDGVERWLIDGELRLNQLPYRTLQHASAMTEIALTLNEWADQQTPPRGYAVCGRCGVQPSDDEETVFGVDVAYIGPELAAKSTKRNEIVHGVPTLIVDIISIEDRFEDVAERVKKYMQFLVPHVWIIDTDNQRALIHRPKRPPYAPTDLLTAEPDLPGLKIALADVFE